MTPDNAMEKALARRLAAHDLGEKGQAFFETVAVDASLIAQKSSRDLTGWDYLAEESAFPDEGTTYDSRPSPLIYKFQVKTKWEDIRQIQIRLSAAERLAKDPDPAFLYVLRTHQDASFSTVRLIHVSGPFLALILKRLRQAQVAKEKVNKVSLSFQLNMYGRDIATTGASLRKALESECGTSRADYSARKHRELETIGYEEGRFRVQTTLGPITNDELVDGILGLRTLTVQSFQQTEQRFGIDIAIPHFPTGVGTIEFQPQPFDVGVVTIRSQRIKSPLVFGGKFFNVPKSVKTTNELITLFRAQLFHLKFTLERSKREQAANIKFTFTADGKAIENGQFRAADWAEFYQMVAALRGDQTVFTMEPKKAPGPISGTLNPEKSEEYDQAHAWAEHCIRVDKLLRRAGVPNLKLSVEEIDSGVDAVTLLDAIIYRPQTIEAVSFTTERMEGDEVFGDEPMLFFSGFWIGKHLFGYCLKLIIRPTFSDVVDWKSQSLSFVRLTRIQDGKRGFDQFIDSMSRELRIGGRIVANGPWQNGPAVAAGERRRS